jgi:hypothetical protein
VKKGITTGYGSATEINPQSDVAGPFPDHYGPQGHGARPNNYAAGSAFSVVSVSYVYARNGDV